MVRKVQIFAKMTVGQLIRNIDTLFLDPTDSTFTNFEVLSAEGLPLSLHKSVEEVSDLACFKYCEIIVNSENVFETSRDFEKKAGLYIQVDSLVNSLLI